MSEEIKINRTNNSNILYNKAKYYIVNSNNTTIDIDHNNYIKIPVTTNDLDLYNIISGDILFVKKVTPADVTKNIDQGSLCLYGLNQPDNSKLIYKTWQVINLARTTSYQSIPNRIMQSSAFNKIAKDIRWASNAYATKHYMDKKIKEFMDKNVYNVAIVTRLDLTGHWIFDIIPANQICGVVEYAIPADKVDLLK